MDQAEHTLRQEIIERCRAMSATGLSQGTSGNISARWHGRMLITPSATPYDALEPDMIASTSLDADAPSWSGPLTPSTEWRFHFDVLRARPEIAAIVHTHSPYATALAMAHVEIPPAHYMIALFGGATVRCAPYARFGTQALSDHALAALKDRTACLLANHGTIALGESLDRAMWRAQELETLAQHYSLARMVGAPVLLSDAQIDEALNAFKSYGRSQQMQDA